MIFFEYKKYNNQKLSVIFVIQIITLNSVLIKSNKSINEITLFRYLFNLDNRDLPQSIFNWYSNVGSVVDSDRENAIRELSRIKGNCRNLVILSKTFIDTMDVFTTN